MLKGRHIYSFNFTSIEVCTLKKATPKAIATCAQRTWTVNNLKIELVWKSPYSVTRNRFFPVM